jgi:tripartite-type tricarboxylate transporter receptor subunit TctC
MIDTTNKAALIQDYPARPVRIIDPFGAGGGPDLLARALAQQLSKLWGQVVTVENITGAGATAGPLQVVQLPANGYTLLINTNAQAYTAAVLKNPPYDPLKDFVPIIPLTSQPYVLVVGKSAGVTTVSQLIAAAKAKPRALTFGSTGIGTSTHIGVMKFNQIAGIDVLHVPPLPTDSNANTVENTIVGHTTYSMLPISLALPAIHKRNLIALGVTTARRSTLVPDVPTIAEAGLAGFDFPIWYGIWVATGTPANVIDKLVQDIGGVLAGQALRDWIARHGGEPMTMTQPEFARFVLTESESAVQIINAAGIEPQ